MDQHDHVVYIFESIKKKEEGGKQNNYNDDVIYNYFIIYCLLLKCGVYNILLLIGQNKINKNERDHMP